MTEETAERRPRRRRRFSPVGAAGELLITAGVIVLLFLGWQTYWNSWVAAGSQQRTAAAQSQKWLDQAQASSTPVPSDGAAADRTSGDIPVTAAVATAQPFAVIYVPRFGADWTRVIRESVDVQKVLNSFTAGVGHYPGTAMPGQVGNFAIAAHDTGYGNTFLGVSTLRIGDPIYLQTADGWYTYRFRNMEYVQPTEVSVIQPVPRLTGTTPQDRLITLTTCNPPYHGRERIIAYGTFDSFRDAADGPPAGIAATVDRLASK